ncbi:MAG: transposase of IS1604-like element [Haloplasmataceae bacterium]|nr:transposase of IS1604-like element [Haloplasmataceae bacterium]
MNEKLLKEIALLKYSIIAPVVTETYATLTKIDHFREESNKKYTLSTGMPFLFSPMTAKGWYLKYQKEGFEGLMPKTRNDAGKPRSLKEDAISRINELKKQYPYITGTLVYQKLVEEGVINKCDTSLSSVLRYIRDNNLKTKQLSGIERRAFEMEFSNDMWQADSSSGPIITIDGKKHKTYMIAFIDDASRLIVGYGVFLNDNAVNMQLVFKQAVAKYGVPKRLFVDNGGPYKNDQLEMICASIGTVLIHSRIYSPESIKTVG